jgi:hypothetical protein
MAGVCDEARLEFDVSRALNQAKSDAELAEVFRIYVEPVEDQISDETFHLLTRLREIRMSAIAWGS